MKNKTVLWSVLLLVTHSLAFIGGAIRGKEVTRTSFEKGFEKADAHVILSHYSTYRDIALGIQSGDLNGAKCEAEMIATTMLDSLAPCLANQECKAGISSKARQFAPELLGEAPLRIEKRKRCPAK